MAITYVEGDIFQSSAQCLVNPVNCVAVMGGGLALDFKRKYPEMFRSYQTLCRSKLLRIGTVAFWKDMTPHGKYVCLFPTKDDWRNPSLIEYVDKSLLAMIALAPQYQITSIAMPKVGCGLGGLDFEHLVQPLIELRLKNAKFDVEVYV